MFFKRENDFNDMDEYPWDNNSETKKERKINMANSAVKLIRYGIIFVVLVILMFSSTVVVPTGYSAVHLRFGTCVGEYQPGLNLKMPIVDTAVEMSTRDEKTDFETEVSSQDMQSIKIKCSVIVSVEPNKVIKVYTKYGKNYMDTIVSPMVYEIINNEVASYPIEQFIDKKPEISNNVKKLLNDKLKGSGIVVKDFVITFHDFDDAYETAITNKKISQQNAEKAKYDFEKTKLDSEAMKLKNIALSELVIREKFLSKWDGKLPQTLVIGDNDKVPFKINKIIK